MVKLILNNKKRIIAFMLAFTIVSSSFYVDYQKAFALEWEITEISLTTALKVLLGLLGVTVGIEVTDDWWEQQYNDCFNYTMDDVELTEQQINEWWNNVKKGVLDKTSPVWESFKEWVKNLFNDGVSELIASDVIINDFPNVYVQDGSYKNYAFVSACKRVMANGYVSYYFFPDNSTVEVNNYSGINYLVFSSSTIVQPSNNNINSDTSSVTLQQYNGGVSFRIYDDDNIYFYNFVIPNGFSNFYDWDFSDNIYDFAYENVENIDVISDESTDVTSETSIPLPWQNDESIADSLEDVIDNAIDKVQTGEMTIEEYWEHVQEITNVYVYDTTTDETLPITSDSETGETEKIDDKITENKDNMAFTLSGLEKVFPFCIPFDIYAFVTLLVAEPVAPVINFPITSVNGQTEVITIDFSEWESIVILFRYIFDFLLIIGLLMLARSLVGAGGDD